MWLLDLLSIRDNRTLGLNVKSATIRSRDIFLSARRMFMTYVCHGSYHMSSVRSIAKFNWVARAWGTLHVPALLLRSSHVDRSQAHNYHSMTG